MSDDLSVLHAILRDLNIRDAAKIEEIYLRVSEENERLKINMVKTRASCASIYAQLTDDNSRKMEMVAAAILRGEQGDS